MTSLEIRPRDFEVTPAMRLYADKRCAFALCRFGSAITLLQLRIEDVNGPRGGVDKLVTLRVRARGVNEVCVQELHGDFNAAVDSLVARAARALDRAYGRLRPRAHQQTNIR